jgi:hypothetical protein
VGAVTLVEFLRARLAEDQAAAQAATAETAEDLAQLLEEEDRQRALVSHWFETMGGGWVRTDWQRIAQIADAHFGRHDPVRVLAEVAAVRRLVDAYAALDADRARLTDAAMHLQWNVLRTVVQTLALPYAGHSDYRASWAP